MPPWPQARPIPTATIAKHRNLASSDSRKSDSTAGASSSSAVAARARRTTNPVVLGPLPDDLRRARALN